MDEYEDEDGTFFLYVRENVASTWERQDDGTWQVRDYVYIRTEDEA